jgi:hypothetical protein
MLAAIFLKTGRYPSEILALPPGERAFCFASVRVENEEQQGGKR